MLVWYVGNRQPSISETITSGGSPVDLTGCTVRFRMRAVGSSVLKVDAAAGVISAVNGQVQYDWAANDVDTAGQYLVWWQVTDGTGKTEDVGESLIEFRAHVSVVSYLELETLKNTLNLSGTSYADSDIQLALVAASRAIDDYCERRFYLDPDTTSVRYYTPGSKWRCEIDDLAVVTSVQHDYNGDGVYEQTLVQDTDYFFEPYNRNLIDGVNREPWTTVCLRELGRFRWFGFYNHSLKVTGQFGWPVVPPAVKEATSILAGRYLKRARETPYGFVGFGADGTTMRISARDPDVAALLHGLNRGMITP